MFLGFDVGGTTLRCALYDPQWQLVRSHTQRIRHTQQGQVSADQLARHIANARDLLCDGAPAALGVGLAAQMDASGSHVHNAPNLGWRDVAFADILQEQLGQRAHLVNDLNALLVGEAVGGAVEGIEDVLAVYVGTGVGGAILSGGRLVLGAGGVAAELGHVKVKPGGRLCGCGERGCLEAYVGGIHLERQVAELAQNTPWRAQVVRQDGSVDLGAADALSDSIQALGALWERSADALALCVANAVTLLNPRALLLGGGVLTHCERLKETTLARMPGWVLSAARPGLRVVFASREDAGMLGAARLAWEARQQDKS